MHLGQPPGHHTDECRRVVPFPRHRKRCRYGGGQPVPESRARSRQVVFEVLVDIQWQNKKEERDESVCLIYGSRMLSISS